jgi:hypothetical protein
MSYRVENCDAAKVYLGVAGLICLNLVIGLAQGGNMLILFEKVLALRANHTVHL